MKIALLGHSGFIGGEILKKLDGQKFEFLLFSRKFTEEKKSGNKLFAPDKKTCEIIEREKPNLIINAVGILKEKEKNEYEKVHVFRLKDILSSAETSGSNIIQISALIFGENCSSRYFLTKKEAEKLIKQSGLNYTILRPGIVKGDGQKLSKTLAKIAAFSPVILSPQGDITLTKIETLVKAVENSVNKTQKETIEISDETVSYLVFFKETLKNLGFKRIVLAVPNIFFFPAAIAGTLLKSELFDLQQYKMLFCSTTKRENQ